MSKHEMDTSINYRDMEAMIEAQLHEPISVTVEENWLELPAIEQEWFELPDVDKEWLQLPELEPQWINTLHTERHEIIQETTYEIEIDH